MTFVEEVKKRSLGLIREYPPGFDDWEKYTYDSHDPGTCVECDAFRLLARGVSEKTSGPDSAE